jgi:ATP-dependent Clp protease adaptor protein ClpS
MGCSIKQQGNTGIVCELAIPFSLGWSVSPPISGGASGALRLARMGRMVTKIPPTTPAPGKAGGADAVVLERLPQRTVPPHMHQVVLLNDDFTPMEFVVLVIQEFFNKDREAATQIMLKIHLEGKGVCGVFPKDIAATKVDQVLSAARHAGHPLQCIHQPIE